MEDFPVNPIDVLVALALLVSAGLAFARGAVREILCVGAWIGAALVTILGFGHLRPYARQLIEVELIADAATGLAIFIAALIVLTLVSQLIASQIQRSRLGALDRTLGIIFGLVRGGVLLCLAYMLFVWAVAEPDRPLWVDRASTMPYIKRGAEAIRTIVPEDVVEQGEKSVGEAADGIRKLREIEEIGEDVRKLTEPTLEDGTADDEAGYGERDRRALEGLADTVD